MLQNRIKIRIENIEVQENEFSTKLTVHQNNALRHHYRMVNHNFVNWWIEKHGPPLAEQLEYKVHYR